MFSRSDLLTIASKTHHSQVMSVNKRELHLIVILAFLVHLSKSIDVTELNVEGTTQSATSPFTEITTQKLVPQTANASDEIKLLKSQTQNFHIDRTIPFDRKNEKKTPDAPRLLNNFKPSQQMESYLEYNKFPVAPAYPEAKTFTGSSIGAEQPILGHNWLDKNENKVRFPPSSNKAPVTVNDHPYPFYFPGDNLNNNNGKVLTSSYGFGGTSKQFGGTKFPGNIYSAPEPWTKYEKDILLKKPPAKIFDDHEYHPVAPIHTGHGVSQSPWKKIIKILTAFIPIGLLISALTPSVITISPMNMTGRARMDGINGNKTVELSNRPSSKLDEMCEDRVLCELLLNAGYSNNSQSNIGSLVQAYTERGQNIADKTEKLRKIFKSIKKENCDAFVCDSIGKKT